MADNTRLAEIAERLSKATPGEWVTLKEAVPGFFGISSRHPEGYRHDLSWAIGMKGHKEDADFIAHAHQDIPWLIAQLTAAQARSREDAEIMRAAADALDEHYDDSGNCFSCHSPCIPDPENYDDLDPSDLVHTSDCLVTKLRARADELGGAG